jgi:cephalosporin-C deacetylase-like acetyl esterase
MIEPEDFGLDWVQTLAHVSEACRCRLHGAFWQQWHKAIDDHEPRLETISPDDDPSDPTATHTYAGVGSCRIGCRLQLPEGKVRAVLMLLHGYEDPPKLAESIARTPAPPGVAVIAMRVRGYAGSRAGVGNLSASELGWITTGLERPPEDGKHVTEWCVSHAIADLLLGIRAARHKLGMELPVYVRGESFGGGLAVVAAARSGAMSCSHPEQRIDRIAVGLPTLGDWRWRLARQHPRSLGAGGQIKRFLMASGEASEEIARLLDLFDAALHAEHVDCPALVKLAVRDEIVPAPTQASVYNALGTPPGLKGRFVTRYGHFDGGLNDLRRHALFEKMSAEFLDPARQPMEVLARWESVMTSGAQVPEAVA